MKQRIGYARVSTEDQHLDLQRDALQQAGCHVIYEETASGKNASRLELERSGIGFESLTEKIETNSAAGKLVFHVFAALAEFERSLIRERTHAGLAAARARGRSGGRKPKLGEKQVREIKALRRVPNYPVQACRCRGPTAPMTFSAHSRSQGITRMLSRRPH
ncbi:recombinase family protein [Acetobacter sp. DmW_043]|uniref:recombinase family protein n=1 Tax=Acetobacter sp. DmW_043 TaxID=1670658 RepID=UPI0011782C83